MFLRPLRFPWADAYHPIDTIARLCPRALLRTIRGRQPRSLTELAALTGRKVPKLSRTLRMMAGYGLVGLQKNTRDVQPTALATEFLIVLE
jgi:predicted transcriptional regulator